MPEYRCSNYWAGAASHKVEGDPKTHGDRASAVILPNVSDDAASGICDDSHAAATEEAGDDECRKVPCHSLRNKRADEYDVRAKENPAKPKILHHGKDHKRAYGSTNGPGRDRPIGMWEVGVTDVESLVDGFVGDRHGGPVEHGRERGTESNRSDNVLLRF